MKPLSTLWITRVVPFAIYMIFIFLQGIIETISTADFSTLYLIPVIYTAKSILVVTALIYFWNSYSELSWNSFRGKDLLSTFFIGILVFILWINLDQNFAKQGETKAYDPNILEGIYYYAFLSIRLIGASVIVPIFEELFWRSFILRYIINADFTSVKLGTFTWPSFIISSILFGLEHNLWLAGIIAGVLYNILLYRTKNLYHCIIAHGITNFLLGIYVIKKGAWEFW